MIHKHSDSNLAEPREVLKNLSSQDFLNFGLEEVAYIRPVEVDGEDVFAIHRADGTPISIAENMDSAIVSARYNDLEPLAVN